MADPQYGVAYIFDLELASQGTPSTFQINPTLAAGDVKITKDGGALANLATLPVVTPAAGTTVKVALSATEMQASRLDVLFVDAAGAEWFPVTARLQTTVVTIDDLLDQEVEGAVTVLQSLRLANSANGGKAAGMATDTATLRDLADTKDRVTATVDASGNRTTVSLDLT